MEALAASHALASLVQLAKNKNMGHDRPSGSSEGATKKRRKQKDENSADAENQILLSNQYSVLTENNVSDDTISRKERIPPLFTTIKDVNTLKAEFEKQGYQPRFKLCSIGTKIMSSSLEEYGKLGAILKSGSVEFYTHDLPSTKPLKVVLRGLPPFNAAEVKAEIENIGLKPLAVFPMTRRSSANKNATYRDQLFLIHFVKGSTSIAALRNIRDLFRVIISWEPYRPQHRDVTQCMKCLRFGHGTKNCHMNPRCDKCALNHISVNCGQSDDIEPKCANCGEAHNASNRSCKKRAEFIDIRQQATKNHQPGRRRLDRPPPSINEVQFPAMQPRRVIPNLEPLPLNNSASSKARFTAQPRLTAAAAGLSYADTVSGITDDSPLSAEELITLVSEVIVIMRTCKTRAQQLQAAVSLITKYGS